LRKEPQRRYASVEQFAEDIQRHLENLPVIARKDTIEYRTSKFLSRHKAGVVAAAVVIFMLLLGMAVTLREARIARAQRARAERRFNDVRALANSLLFDIHDSIRDLPGSTAARKVLVDRALQYLDSLAQEAAGDPSLEREVASAYERLGDVQGKPLAPSLGDGAGALQSYNKSLALREKLAQNSQAYPDDAVSLAKIHRLIANVAVESGDIGGALEHAKKAVALAASVSDSGTRNNKPAASELALDYTALGCIESGGGFNSAGLSDPFAALHDFDKALAITSQLLKNDPDDVTLARETAVLYERIGGLQGLMMGRRPEGLRNLNVALKIFRSLSAQSNNAGFQRAVGAAASVIGGVLVMDGRFQPALASFREELAISERLSERDPQNQQARKDLTSSYYDVGGALTRLGRLGEGLAMIRSAIALDKQLLSLDPKQAVLGSNLAQHRVAEGETLGRMGDAAGALQSYKEARSFYGGLARLDKQNLDARLNASATDGKIAATLFRLGQFDEARETYRRVLQVSEPPAGSNPPNQQAQYTLADAYSGLGDVAMYVAGRTKYPIKQLSYWREASSWYEKSLGIWHAIPNRSVVSPAWFDVGDPAQVANHLAVCKAALGKMKSSPAATTASEMPAPKVCK
jgi:tetratricopeptide (TPR) repeat protein